MKVAFDSRPAKDWRGIGRYARCLLEALRELDRGEITETHEPRPRRCDIFHSPWIDGAMLRSPVPMVVTLHDLVPLKRRGEYLRSGLRFKLRYLAVQRAVRVIVPTHAVADDAINVLEIPADRITVIGEAVAPRAPRARTSAEVAAVREQYALPEDYLLWVGGPAHAGPAQAGRRARPGASARCRSCSSAQTGRWAHELPDVTLTGAVTDDELAAIYTGAHALVFPSDDEGFGLPPIEALACGTPVAACDVPALREVLDGRAALTPVDDLDALIVSAESLRRPAPAPPPWSWATRQRRPGRCTSRRSARRVRWRGARRRPRGRPAPQAAATPAA